MSTTAEQTEVPTPVTPEQPPVAEAEKDPVDALFKWNAWLHVGAGAEECEHGTDGECKDSQHFHAWCRLPNPWQVRDITDKAQAAQARYTKMLRDPNSDEAVVFEEDEIEPLRNALTEILVDEILDRSFHDDYPLAVRAVESVVDPDWEPPEDDPDAKAPMLYEGIDQDREEWQRQSVLEPEQRSADYDQMVKNIAEYGKAIEAEMERLQAPRREALMETDKDELIDMVRRARIEARATEVYLHWYNTWQWFVCTFKPTKKGTPNERVWGDINQMKQQAPPEVVHAMKALFEGLEQSAVASRRGKDF